MSVPSGTPSGNPAREAIDSLRGYVYQIYQSALAWTDVTDGEFLFLEVAEDFVIAADGALNAVQVKDTSSRVTINSDDIVTSIDSFVELKRKNPDVSVTLHHLTTSSVGKEKSSTHRIGDTPTLIAWRSLAKAGDLADFRKILGNSKLSKITKAHIVSLSDSELREGFLKKIHFDCGAPDSKLLARQIEARVSLLLRERGGLHSQAEGCIANILLSLLKLATNSSREERFVNQADLEKILETATHITLNRSQFDSHSRLIQKALSPSLHGTTDLRGSGVIGPSPISEVPLPTALATRSKYVRRLSQSLESNGICWISGAAGMGKTIAARTLAHGSYGNWAGINLRGESNEQVSQALSHIANEMPSFGLQGLIIDDLDCSLGTSVSDNLHYLFHSASRSDIPLVVTSNRAPTSEFLFAFGLQDDINVTLNEFSEEDIEEILVQLGVEHPSWKKYTFMVSGGGHPQLAIAFIQSMASSGWDTREFETLSGLLEGSPAVNEVRRRAGERLLKDMPDSNRRLIERLSMKAGGFSRELVLDLGKASPRIQDAGIVLDNLTGSWIDQHEGDRFSLSPLLSNYAEKTLTEEDRLAIHSAIAESLTKGPILNTSDMNSALVAAWASSNTSVITKLSLGVLVAEQEVLAMLAPQLPMFTLFRTDTIAYPSDPVVNQIFRGVQLLLLCQTGPTDSKLTEALQCFSNESKNVDSDEVRISMNLMIYSKLLLQAPKGALEINFVYLIKELDRILQDKGTQLPSSVRDGFDNLRENGVSPLGFMFLNQVHCLMKIGSLTVVFDFLSEASLELRSTLLAPFNLEDFEVDFLVSGAWLNEHENKTIDPSTHCAVYADLEEKATNWNRLDIAACCRKYHAIILDEYGDNKDSAIAVLDRGLELYGQTNYELVRAKAKVLYRSEDHQASFALSKMLIENDAPLSDVEKAFLGREAAISAEKQEDFESARQCFLFGSEGAGKSGILDMAPMRVGLLADAALASWYSGDRLACLRALSTVLQELDRFPAGESLRTAHCHAVTRHVLLWLDQETTGESHVLADGEEARIYPGCVSNPEPHPEIMRRPITPIDMAWYMLAAVENHALLEAGITKNLGRLLPNGPVIEGQMILSRAKMHKSLAQLDTALFIDALTDTISIFSFVQASQNPAEAFDMINITHGTSPLATEVQQASSGDLTQHFILLFFAMCILKEEFNIIRLTIRKLSRSEGFEVRPDVLERLQANSPATDYFTDFARLIYAHAGNASGRNTVSPRQVFELSLKILHAAKITSNYRLTSECLLPWLEKKWKHIWQSQRFLLIHPSLQQGPLQAAMNSNAPAQKKLVELLTAILPTIDVPNRNELKKIVSEFSI